MKCNLKVLEKHQLNIQEVFIMTNVSVFIVLIIFVALLALLGLLQKRKVSFTIRVMLALAVGLVFGAVIQYLFGRTSDVATLVKSWLGIVGSGFTKLLQFLIVPLVLVSILNAISKVNGGAKAARTSGKVIAVLLGTTAISAIIGFLTVQLLGLNAIGLINAVEKTDKVPTDIPTSILNIIPTNIFDALTTNSALPVVFIAALLGMAFLAIRKDNEALGARIIKGVDSANEIVMTLTDFVIKLTPYGVLALITRVTATSDFASVLNLLSFVLGTFFALIVVFIIHLIILSLFKVNPIQYLKKAASPLLFAFTSRSSAATLPMTIKTQTDKLGVSKIHADLAGSFGTTIGQNGCAGVYPAIVATLVAGALGWNVWSLSFVLPLILYVTISSIGIAGVGGGATNATILVLSLLGLPIELVAILVSVEFLIDMGRTALNVNDSILAGVITAKWDKDFNEDIFYDRVQAADTLAPGV